MQGRDVKNTRFPGRKGTHSCNDLAACGIDEHHLQSLAARDKFVRVDGVTCKGLEAALWVTKEGSV